MFHFSLKLISEVWLYPGVAGWHFVSVPKKEATQIKEWWGKRKRGWGTIPIVATLGGSVWKTSLFPDKKSGGYLVPIRANIRKKEQVEAGKKVSWSIEITKE